MRVAWWTQNDAGRDPLDHVQSTEQRLGVGGEDRTRVFQMGMDERDKGKAQ